MTRPDDYGLSVRLHRRHHHHGAGPETATVTGCALTWNSPLTGRQPASPTSPNRFELRRVLGQGYQITDYRPC